MQRRGDATTLFMAYRIERAVRRTGYAAMFILAMFAATGLYDLDERIASAQSLLH
ncbi:MAG: hypothetical protein ACREDL_16760 [Bradyrhizobium sp.]